MAGGGYSASGGCNSVETIPELASVCCWTDALLAGCARGAIVSRWTTAAGLVDRRTTVHLEGTLLQNTSRRIVDAVADLTGLLWVRRKLSALMVIVTIQCATTRSGSHLTCVC